MLGFFNRDKPAIPADRQADRALLAPTPLTIRKRHIDIELGKLAAIQPRTETTRGALDFWLDRRLALRPGGEGGTAR